ncbi:TadE/TadG family type IV pilus assembly protein [Rhizobium leguminosarum]|uniref:TadE/TadG family type IV pilus assembly protein n=1 Tax=Rhizobium leguminosarum TaxID=384 RepID=UPI00103F0C75|nr:pilus assembly protein [Rhizobium leguminosarum]MBY5780340.1 pilus assembly protein [Rhizobium leguminosarum]MBY5786277.1 pilus assembly protein [Rhizobium leguminosarum]MBY5799155.1 pilus assembly protein [Rhizobium leguminosarum]TBZ15641.1 pilus assembly protein [Rhizobium leguminosarum bv. viciae]TBZ24623.1 pilus assembly protein [Rhizobium leguminosarum bv. viciae]
MPGLPSTHTEPMSGLPGRGLLMRLHRDRRGLASIEFVLAAPVILLIVIFVIHANKISTKKVGTMVAMRNAAFAEANGLDCTSDFSNVFPIPALPALPGRDAMSCSRTPSHEGGGDPQRTFVWDDVQNTLESDGRQFGDMVGDLANEKPQLVTATADRVYKFRDSDDLDTIRSIRWKDAFTVDDSTLFASHNNDTTRRGYDPTLRREIRGVASDSGDLFDGVFPGAK